MADNVAITPGTGATIATDEVGGAQYQRIKIAWGADGSATDTSAADPLPVTVSNSVPVTGTFYQATQPISAAALPLPSGAATSVKQPAIGAAGSASTDVLTVQGIASMTALKVDGSGVTQPVSAAALPLPSGAATVAKQPSLGTAGSASSDVISVQGIASMTALKVDNSAVTQPVSASVKQTLGSVDTFTVTNLHSLATSATAGWRSAAIDNTSNRYIEYAVQLVLAAVNTAAGNSKAFFLYMYAQLDTSGSDWTTTGAASGGAPDGSEGTITFPDITANSVNLKLVAVIPYVGQNAAIVSPWIPISPAMGGLFIPSKFGFALINHSGFTIAASGNSFKGRGYYNSII